MLKQRATTLLIAAAGLLVYVGVGAALTTGDNPRSKLLLLILQYVILLPVIAWLIFGRQKGLDLHFRIPKRLILGLYVAGAILFSWQIRDGIYNADESAYRFEASALVTGHLTAPAPLLDSARPSDFYFLHHIIRDGKWFGKYPLGWPAILAIGKVFHGGWLVNPLLGLVLLLLAARIAGILFDEQTAALTIAFLIASPFFFFNCVGYLSHAACGVLIAGAFLSLLLFEKSGRLAWFGLMMLLIGLACRVRLYTGALEGLLIGCAGLWAARGVRSRFFAALAISIAAAVGTGGVTLLYNYALTGHPWLSPYALYSHSRIPTEIALSLPRILDNLISATRMGSGKMLMHCFPFVFLLAAYGLIREGKRGVLLAALMGILVLGYLVQSDRSDSLVGERYYFEGYWAIAILAARGCFWLAQTRVLNAYRVALASVVLLCAQAFLYGYLTRTILILKRPSAEIVETAPKLGLGRAVIFLHTSAELKPNNFNPNSARWRQESLIYLPDPGPTRRRIVAHALGRRHWAVLTCQDPAIMPLTATDCPVRVLGESQ